MADLIPIVGEIKAQPLNDNFSALNSELVNKHVLEELWSGIAYEGGTNLSLTGGSLADYSYLIVVVNFAGIESRVINHKEAQNFYLKGINLVNSGTSTSLSVVEIQCVQTSNTNIQIGFNYLWQWSGNSAQDATISADDNGMQIRKIIGVR